MHNHPPYLCILAQCHSFYHSHVCMSAAIEASHWVYTSPAKLPSVSLTAHKTPAHDDAVSLYGLVYTSTMEKCYSLAKASEGELSGLVCVCLE